MPVTVLKAAAVCNSPVACIGVFRDGQDIAIPLQRHRQFTRVAKIDRVAHTAEKKRSRGYESFQSSIFCVVLVARLMPHGCRATANKNPR
jgi:hypothetical protein